MLTESLLLSILGGAGGLLLASWSTSLLANLLPQSFPGNSIPPDVSPDRAGLCLRVSLIGPDRSHLWLGAGAASSKPNVIAALKDDQLWFGAGRRRFSPRNFSWSRKLLFLCSCSLPPGSSLETCATPARSTGL
jgi:hypothetical protein